MDKRNAFVRKTLPTDEERRDAQAFIKGKIDMVRSDPSMTAKQKAEAIASLEAQLED